MFGLTSQIRRACSSIPANLLLLARDLKLIQAKDYQELVVRTVEAKRMLSALIQKLEADRL